MTQWMRENPFLTFLIIWIALATIESVIGKLRSLP